MKIALIIFLSTFGVFHLQSFLWSYRLVDSKPNRYAVDGQLKGIFSLLVFQFLGAGVLSILFKQSSWWIWTLLAAFISQIIVVGSWDELKYFSLLNLGLIIVSLLAFKFVSFEEAYQKDIQQGIERTSSIREEILNESDIVNLPSLVQKYLRASGVLGKPKVYNMKVRFSGEMRNKDSAWFNFKSEQYNFFDIPQRNFFIKAKINRIPTWGYHAFANGKASMDIKALSTIPLVSIRSKELDISETVTVFNDMCILAPATLIDNRISWEAIDDRSVRAAFTNAGITISAILYINDKGQLINFISEDRIEINEKKKIRFSTPMGEYKDVNGYRLPTRGEATWHYLDGPFAYGIFHLESVEYNVKPKKIKSST